MRNIPGKTLFLIAFLITLTVALLAIAIWAGGKKDITTTMLGGPTPTIAIDKTAEISFVPPLLDLSLSTTPSATVDIIATTGKNPITGTQVELTYDPATITNVKLLPPDATTSLFGATTDYTNLFTDTKTPGQLTFALAINPTGTPVTGTGSIGKISFSVVKGAAPTATISFGKGTVVTSQKTQDSILNTTTPLTIKLK